MLNALDSFVTWLYAMVGSSPLIVPVVLLRVNGHDGDQLQLDALNVRMLSAERDGNFEGMTVSLDLVGGDERVVWGWATQVRSALTISTIPEYDYITTPGTPIRTGRNVMWEDTMSFELVGSSEHYVHINCTFDIEHAR